MAEEAQALGLALGLGTESSPGTTLVEDSVTRAGASRRRRSPRLERARRQAMSVLFDELGALLPDLPHRACKADIVDGAIAYVRALEDTAAELEAHRAMSAGRSRRARHGGGAAEVVVAGETSCFAVRLRAARPGALTRVLQVFQRHRVPVLATTVSRNGGEAAVTVTTAVVAPAVAGKIEADIISSNA
ncbi:hypothetical protein CFC21_005618 [Triticum aestivum]|uniref:BHLH domain-containing protein n=2 Tax=Triticum aestivum TaxID=4565 RepID=A0A9R1DAB4_WHEAT|nr:uncharacterized protein LOC123087685 [Triticum aestivum]KAF6988032.1 hypothetical protein CFC21_005618 [Triticum aestivum]